MAFQLPRTKLGYWSVILAVIGFVSVLFSFSPHSWLLSPCLWPLIGLIAGIAGLIAVVRDQERSWLVFLAIPLGFGGIGFFTLFIIMWLMGAFS